MSDLPNDMQTELPSVSWGLGASYRIGENVGVSLDYMVYHKKSQVKVDGVNLGVTYKF